MKKKKRAQAFIAEKMGKDTYEEVRALEKSVVNTEGAINPLAEFGNVKSIRDCPSAQMQLYESENLDNMEYFFIHGGCFERQVQRQMIKDNNLEVLKVFLKYWEFTPDERVFMIKQSSLEFLKMYLEKKSLGKQMKDFVGCGRFPRTFWAEIYQYLTPDAKELCVRTGKVVL